MTLLTILPGWRRCAGGLTAAGLAVCLVTGNVQSQETPPATASPTATTAASDVQAAEPNSPVLVVDMRPEADIQWDLDAARILKPKAQADEQKAGGEVIQSKATLEMKRKDLEALKTQLDQTKKSGTAAERAALDRQRQQTELDIKLLERLVAVRECQVELGRARRNFADVSTVALESELAMGKKRTSWDSLTQPGTTVTSAQDIVALQVEIRSDERRVLLAMKDRSLKGEEVAKKEGQLIQRQIEVLEADTAIQQFATRAH